MIPSPKPCKYCGRDFEWRKKWQSSWDEVKFCSVSCSKKNSKTADIFEKNILDLLEVRGAQKSICPSEVLKSEDKKNPLKMEQVRCAARRLVHKDKILITQRNKVVDPSKFKGPIRLKLK